MWPQTLIRTSTWWSTAATRCCDNTASGQSSATSSTSSRTRPSLTSSWPTSSSYTSGLSCSPVYKVRKSFPVLQTFLSTRYGSHFLYYRLLSTGYVSHFLYNTLSCQQGTLVTFCTTRSPVCKVCKLLPVKQTPIYKVCKSLPVQ